MLYSEQLILYKRSLQCAKMAMANGQLRINIGCPAHILNSQFRKSLKLVLYLKIIFCYFKFYYLL